MAELGSLLVEAAAGDGGIAVLSGEAGIGKSAVVRAFTESVGSRAVVHGACDDLTTPSPLAPLVEIARQCDRRVVEGLRDAESGAHAAQQLLVALERLPPPLIVVLEDLHWVDDATLDVLTLLARWVTDRSAVLVTTHRDDEVDAHHPLTRVLARFPSHRTRQLALGPLDADAVARLAADHGAQDAVDEILRVTGGNAFYVTEALAAGHDGPLPASVAFAVDARLANLPEDTGELLRLMSLIPGRVPIEVLDRLAPGWPTTLAPAETVGVVELHDDSVSFRHELARRAVEEGVPRLRARAWHARILEALGDDVSAATVVHHAERAGDATRMAAAAVRATFEAARTQSFRQVVAHAERALADESGLDIGVRVDLWHERARASFVTGRIEDQERAATRAVELARSSGDAGRLSRALAGLARVVVPSGDLTRATASAREAVATALAADDDARSAPDVADAHLAAAYAAYAGWDFPTSGRHAGAALAAARRAGDGAAEAHATVFLAGIEVALTGDTAGLEAAERAAAAAGHRWATIEGLMLGASALSFRRSEQAAIAVADRALAYAGDHDLAAGWGAYLRVLRARARIGLGQWDRAMTELDETSDEMPLHAWPEAGLRATRGVLRARLGHDGAEEDLATAWELASRGDTFQPRFLAALGVAEHRWLAGRLTAPPPALLAVAEHPVARRYPPIRGAIAVWLQRAGVDVEVDDELPGPHRRLLTGDVDGAAAAWDALALPYEAAQARTLGDDPAALVGAIDVLDRLGAEPLARMARHRLRDLGHRPPGRANRATRAHPLGLTARQAEVLELIEQGATNADIAERLVLSIRTVDHHVSAILRRLGAGDRREAAAIAREHAS